VQVLVAAGERVEEENHNEDLQGPGDEEFNLGPEEQNSEDAVDLPLPDEVEDDGDGQEDDGDDFASVLLVVNVHWIPADIVHNSGDEEEG
jgi:hypothetical protein